MGRAYLIFILIGGLLGAMLPSGRDSRTTDNFQNLPKQTFDTSPARQSPASGTSSSTSASGEIELKRESNGHFYADVLVNGQSLRVLVDTGATGIALTRSDAQRAGLGVSIGMYEVVGKGANGDVRGEFVTLDRVSLGSTSIEGVQAIVLDAGDQSLLGQSFLSKFDSVEIRGDTMVLRS